jgi:hypothetical protein
VARHHRALLSFEIQASAPFDLLELTLFSFLKHPFGIWKTGESLVISNELRLATIDNSTDRQLRLPWMTDLAHQDEVQGGIQTFGDLKTDRHPASGQGEDNRIFEAERDKLLGQRSTSRLSVGEVSTFKYWVFR